MIVNLLIEYTRQGLVLNDWANRMGSFDVDRASMNFASRLVTQPTRPTAVAPTRGVPARFVPGNCMANEGTTKTE